MQTRINVDIAAKHAKPSLSTSSDVIIIRQTLIEALQEMQRFLMLLQMLYQQT